MGMNCGSGNDWKLRKPMVRPAQGTTTPDIHSRRHSGGVGSLHQSRTKQSHQSNGSIQSDSPSSNSISPAPSPSPRPQSVNTNNNNVGLGKRWNSTGDFNVSALTGRYVYRNVLNFTLCFVHFSSFFSSFVSIYGLSIFIYFRNFRAAICTGSNLFAFFVVWFWFCCRLSTKSLLNLSTKTVQGHVLKHGYVFLIMFSFFSSLRSL